jgi:hypothetical protein
MSDLRLCKICDREIDIELPGTRVLVVSRKRTTLIDPHGQAHVVITRYQSERKRNQVSTRAKRGGEVR